MSACILSMSLEVAVLLVNFSRMLRGAPMPLLTPLDSSWLTMRLRYSDDSLMILRIWNYSSTKQQEKQ
ncbi:hypothetical protein BX661DRAFT_58575 [Kickxella alabastrina]|uniref:uncharacterized protein n=1 Tax=Kickxella alabastrina TaxID=61397 RepID=UPI00221FA3A2|nr:uncharacterized protein BX661DRAFT_58575 [Kickxella alabastrina]KAI7822815.1 hypothetical protein BX661DRAFT_58575 [Kickxella alabastrina]